MKMGTIEDVLNMKKGDKPEKKKIVWLGAENCDFCHENVGKFDCFYDATTVYGPWALMCPKCFREHGGGQIGVGRGQKYDGRTREKIGG